MQMLGIDIGGSGVKGSIADLSTGTLLHERHRIETPALLSPDEMAQAIADIARFFEWNGPVGCGFPGVIMNGIARTAANIDKRFIGFPVSDFFSQRLGQPVHIINDADAAGLGEATYGAGLNQQGTILLLTIGTGIGSAIILDGKLLPNTELGHLKFKGDIAERYASDAARKHADLSWKEWGLRFDEFLAHVYGLFYPDMIIVGGGTSKKFDKFAEFITTPCPVVPALLQNQAGIVGAALAARHLVPASV
ncbi:MAG: ROK family protein [Bacteroidia bacterium]|nr:ROK family protein [Bacteroidia bacterium]